ncbi:hypothetical protein AN958_12420 [Leucoagaricus sp. SymC.cos]|nr:hypothetical protein AN958_12420 [Leucoagaricus sp. SymC.cos]
MSFMEISRGNILILPNGSACLADFGLSSIIDQEELKWNSIKTISKIGGTIRWEAPELLVWNPESENPKLTFKTDVYSMASMVYEVRISVLISDRTNTDNVVIMKILQDITLTKPSTSEMENMELTDEIWQVMQTFDSVLTDTCQIRYSVVTDSWSPKPNWSIGPPKPIAPIEAPIRFTETKFWNIGSVDSILKKGLQTLDKQVNERRSDNEANLVHEYRVITELEGQRPGNEKRLEGMSEEDLEVVKRLREAAGDLPKPVEKKRKREILRSKYATLTSPTVSDCEYDFTYDNHDYHGEYRDPNHEFHTLEEWWTNEDSCFDEVPEHSDIHEEYAPDGMGEWSVVDGSDSNFGVDTLSLTSEEDLPVSSSDATDTSVPSRSTASNALDDSVQDMQRLSEVILTSEERLDQLLRLKGAKAQQVMDNL